MALSEEAILQQINVLTTKTSDNEQMVYKAVPAINKGLDPKYFTGNDTKIVNAINKIASDIKVLNEAVINMINKTNQVLLETYSTENQEIWEKTQELMGETTIIEGIKAILEGKKLEQILGLQAADDGKILTVSINNEGIPEVKPISIEAIDVEVSAYDVGYLNRDMKGVTSVGEAIDMICSNSINNVVMENDTMKFMSNSNGELASVPLMDDTDLHNILTSLDE